MGSGGSDSERRQSTRHLACAPTHIQDSDGKQHLSLIHDLSVTGALIYTRSRVTVGDVLDLTLYLDDTEVGRKARGEVIRFERREGGVLWPFLVGIRFETSLDDIEDKVKALAEHQAKIGGLEPG